MRRFLVFVVLIVVATPAIAQQTQPQPGQPEIVFRLTSQEAQVIAEALLERPAKQVMGILSKMQKQYEEQIKKPEEPSKP